MDARRERGGRRGALAQGAALDGGDAAQAALGGPVAVGRGGGGGLPWGGGADDLGGLLGAAPRRPPPPRPPRPPQRPRAPSLPTAHLPRLGLCQTPSPITPLSPPPGLEGLRLYVKRDGLLSALYGGNKARKLDFVLADALRGGARAVCTVGGEGSHHALATALHARAVGLEAHLLLTPQPHTAHSRATHAAALAAATSVTALAASDPRSFAVGLAAWRERRRGYLIPTGGSCALGAVGMAEGALELRAQVDAGLLPPPRALYIAAGSGSSLAGLLLGLAAAWPDPRARPEVIAARVTPRHLVSRGRVLRIHEELKALLWGEEAPPPHVAAPPPFELLSATGPGYGAPSAAGEEARGWAEGVGFKLDPSYMGKMMGLLWARERERAREEGRAVVAWGTGAE
ncbi:MAG: pyridoxal-phosphate dependent enzyme [Deltaproteobacteria bacterium]|nr:pyridoxal-phosphate dependent enzyme [Deltaproteobacteria bacterium]